MIKKDIDYKLLFAVLGLVVFGMIMVSSVSVYPSFSYTNRLVARGEIEEPYNYFYVFKNIISVIMAVVALAFTVKIDYKFFEKYAKQIFIGSIIGLILVFFVGTTLKGARGWISVGGGFTIQPAEFAKIALIIFLARFFSIYKPYLKTFKKGFLPFFGIIGIILLLVGAQPDFGTILVILPVSTIMFFYAGANIRYLLGLFALGVLLIVGVYSYGDYNKETKESLNKLGYITRRIDEYLISNKVAIDTGEIGHQTKQGLIAIGSGGFKGRGFGGSIQKFGYLPEVQGDFIFSVIVEELGFLGGLTLIMVYLFIGYRGFYIANNVKSPFAKYTAIGITSRFLFQTFINIGVNLNLIPNTGKTLPFVSYGGSSLLSLMIALGILLSISRYIAGQPAYKRLEKRKVIF